MTDEELTCIRQTLVLGEEALRVARAVPLEGERAKERDRWLATLVEQLVAGYDLLDPAMGRLRRGLAYIEDLIQKLKRGETSPLRPPWTPEQAIAAFEKQVADGYAILRGEPATTEH